MGDPQSSLLSSEWFKGKSIDIYGKPLCFDHIVPNLRFPMAFAMKYPLVIQQFPIEHDPIVNFPIKTLSNMVIRHSKMYTFTRG